MFGPNLPRPKPKRLRTKTKKTMSKAATERMILQRQERRRRKEERLQRQRQKIKDNREKQRRTKGSAGELRKAKAKRDPKSNHGCEPVDTFILKLLRKSHKTKKVAEKGKKKVVQKEKGSIEKQETVGRPWRSGMREEASEGWQEERKLKKKAAAERVTKKKGLVSSKKPYAEPDIPQLDGATSDLDEPPSHKEQEKQKKADFDFEQANSVNSLSEIAFKSWNQSSCQRATKVVNLAPLCPQLLLLGGDIEENPGPGPDKKISWDEDRTGDKEDGEER